MWAALRMVPVKWDLRDLGAAVGNVQVRATMYAAAQDPAKLEGLHDFLRQLAEVPK